MARIDFAFGASERLRAACEVVRKHYQAGHPVVVYSRDKPLLERFDQMLWGVAPTAFVPHVFADDPLAAQTPVLLTSAPPVARPEAWLLNLDTQCPPGCEQFERVLEIVSQDENETQAARERWKQYKADGHEIQAHDISARAARPANP